MLLCRNENFSSPSSVTSSIFGGVSLASSGGGASPFANFSFGGTNVATKSNLSLAPATMQPFSDVTQAPKSATPNASSSEYKEKQIRLAKRFREHVLSLNKYVLDPMGMERYLTAFLSYRTSQYNQPPTGGEAPVVFPAGSTKGDAASPAVPQPKADVASAFKSDPFSAPTSASNGGTSFFHVPAAPAAMTPVSSDPAGLSSAPTSSQFLGFNFGVKPSASSMGPPPTFGGFSTTPSTAVTEAATGAKVTVPTAPDGNAEENEDNDESNMAATSDDRNVEIVYESSNCNVFQFHRDKPHQLRGTGVLKLQRNKTTGFCSAVVVRSF
jgi:hypothetical protein